MGSSQVRIMDQMASRLSVRLQVSFIKTNTYVEGIGLRLVGFCVMFLLWFDGLSLVTFFGLFAVNSLNLSRPRLINLAKIIMEGTITSLRLRVRQGRCTTCCVDLL